MRTPERPVAGPRRGAMMCHWSLRRLVRQTIIERSCPLSSVCAVLLHSWDPRLHEWSMMPSVPHTPSYRTWHRRKCGVSSSKCSTTCIMVMIIAVLHTFIYSIQTDNTSFKLAVPTQKYKPKREAWTLLQYRCIVGYVKIGPNPLDLFNRFDRVPTCDRHTDGQTDSIYRAHWHWAAGNANMSLSCTVS